MKKITPGTSQKYILIADSHLNGGEQMDRFFCLLQDFSTLPPDYGIVFLGDVFDLWIALPGYETEEQIRFAAWCRAEKQKRTILFLEGNHEFYLSVTRKQDFTCVSDTTIRCGDLLFLHGDRINRSDWKYFLLRTGIRNPFTRLLLRLTAGGGLGPKVCWKIRHGLRGTNLANKKYFPENHALHTIQCFEKQGILCAAAGHFHQIRELDSGGCRFYVLPAFSNAGEAGLLDPAEKTLKILPYTAILSQYKET